MCKTSKVISALAIGLFAVSGCSQAQETNAAQDASQTTPQITMGNGEFNSIQVDGLMRSETEAISSDVRTNKDVSTFRSNSTALVLPEVTIAKTGWIVLHPFVNGKPDGNRVSGFTYLDAGTNKNVNIQMDHRAHSGDKFIVMLHNDIDEDKVLDFVFVEDGINVEDKAVFEGNRMIAHIISVP